MIIEGELRELQDYFSFAVHTNCKMMYWTKKGDLFLLYHGNRFVYFKTRSFISHNAALSYIALTNLYHFIQASKKRNRLNKKEKIDSIKIYKHKIVMYSGSNLAGEEHIIKTPFVIDSMFSDIFVYMDNLKAPGLTKGLPTLRIKRSLLCDYYSDLPNRLLFKKMNAKVKEKDFNKVHEWQEECQSTLICSRSSLSIQHAPGVKKQTLFEKQYSSDFVPLIYSTNEVFYLSDHALWLIRRMNSLSKDTDVYLYKSKDFSFVEVNTEQVRLRIVDPFIKKHYKGQKLL